MHDSDNSFKMNLSIYMQVHVSIYMHMHSCITITTAVIVCVATSIADDAQHNSRSRLYNLIFN